MRIFVTGGSGFIGRALVQRLLGSGHQVVAWVRSEARAASLLGPQVTLVSTAGGVPALQRAVATCEAAVNLAGEPILSRRWSSARRDAIVRSRLDLTGQLVEAMRARPGPRVLLSASAVGFYGDRSDEPLDEASSPGYDFLADLCRRWEAAALRANEFGVRVLTPRIGVVLGREGGALARMVPLMRLGAGGPLGSGRQFMPWIHLADLIELLMAGLSDERLAGPVVAAAPNPVRNRDFMQALGRVLHRPSLLPAPGFALRLVLGEAATVLLTGQRATSSRLRDIGFNWQFPTVEAALEEILRGDPPDLGPLGPQSPPPAPVNDSDYLKRHRPSYLLRQTTRLKRPLNEVFAFFSDPRNLGVLTPAAMAFEITQAPGVGGFKMQPGLTIDYRLKLGGAIPVRWRTRIEEWQAEQRFIDSQDRGPYQCWWHEHHFRAEGETTVMEDRVYYAPPLGIAGRAANGVAIAPALRQIFRYRAQVIRLRFGAPPPAHPSVNPKSPTAG